MLIEDYFKQQMESLLKNGKLLIDRVSQPSSYHGLDTSFLWTNKRRNQTRAFHYELVWFGREDIFYYLNPETRIRIGSLSTKALKQLTDIIRETCRPYPDIVVYNIVNKSFSVITKKDCVGYPIEAVRLNFIKSSEKFVDAVRQEASLC